MALRLESLPRARLPRTRSRYTVPAARPRREAAAQDRRRRRLRSSAPLWARLETHETRIHPVALRGDDGLDRLDGFRKPPVMVAHDVVVARPVLHLALGRAQPPGLFFRAFGVALLQTWKQVVERWRRQEDEDRPGQLPTQRLAPLNVHGNHDVIAVA